MYEFDQDTIVEQLGPGRFAGRLSDRWNIGRVPNGGYVLSLALAAARQTLTASDPLTVTAHYLRPSAAGPARIHVETLKVGRQYSTVCVRLLQKGKENARVLATYGDLGADCGPAYVYGAPPALPPPDTLVAAPAVDVPEFARRMDIRPAPTNFEALRPNERPEISGWLRFADRRPLDVYALALIADGFPPAVFRLLPPAWIPTIELTVHMRARPVSGWVRCMFRSRFIFGGLLEEDGEIWDENGTLLALSRQLAVQPRQ